MNGKQKSRYEGRRTSLMDRNLCETSVKKTRHLLIVEKDCRFAGAGAAIEAR